MPILDGVEAFKQIREYETVNNLELTPVSALTANAIKGEKEKFLELGMNYYLTKPIKLNDLKELFNIYLVNKEKSSIQSITKKQEFINTKEKEPEISSNSLFLSTFDKNDAITQLGLDESTVDMLLDNFFLTLDIDLQNIQNAIDEKDSNKIVHAAHYLKGSCANLMMNDAKDILEEIETKAKDSQIAFDLTQLKYIFKEIKKIYSESSE